jgi:hypothetical protein
MFLHDLGGRTVQPANRIMINTVAVQMIYCEREFILPVDRQIKKSNVTLLGAGGYSIGFNRKACSIRSACNSDEISERNCASYSADVCGASSAIASSITRCGKLGSISRIVSVLPEPFCCGLQNADGMSLIRCRAAHTETR